MEQNKSESDFREVFGVEPGRELMMFPSILKLMLTFEAVAPEENELDFLNQTYERFLPEGSERNFQILFRELEREFVGSESPQPEQPPEALVVDMNAGAVGIQRLSFGELDDALRTIGPALRVLLLMDTRVNGSIEVPSEWTRDGLSTVMSSKEDVGDPRHWDIYLRDGIAFYLGQRNAGFDALSSYARYLFSRESDLEEAALYLWDEIGQMQYSGNWAGVIDGLRLVDQLPPRQYRVGRVLEGYRFLSSDIAGVRLAAAKLFDRHPLPEFVEELQRLALIERVGMVSEVQIRALRRIGGQPGFDALLQIAQNALLPSAAKLATRALAWVTDYPQRMKRILDLCRSRESRIRSLGASALSESKYHSVFAYGGLLVSKEEHEFAEAFKGLMDGYASEAQLERLREGFANGQLLIDAGEGADANEVNAIGATVITKDGTVVLKLREEHMEAGRLAIRRVFPSSSF